MNNAERSSVVELYKALKGVDRDDDIDDELARAQNELQILKTSISELSKQNYIYEQDVRYLDARIALIIQNRINSEEAREMASRLQVVSEPEKSLLTPEQQRMYGALFCILQSEPQHIARLCRQVSMGEIDDLLQTVMFSIYGNQFDTREEHLLLVMFQQVLANQFEAAQEFTSLLRANTPVSRMMTTYTRRGPGQAYLQDVVAAPLGEILACNEEMDISPLRAYNSLKKENPHDPYYSIPFTVQDAASHPKFRDVQALLEPRFALLKGYCSHLLDVIISRIDRIPYGLRWMAKQVRLLAQSKFPRVPQAQLSSLLGGYFFLRFITPAIVTPQAYMLIDQAPRELARRNLTTIAKCVQLIANQSSGSKEIFTVNINEYVKGQDARVQQFLNNICDVPDFYDSLELDQYMALASKERMLKITYQETLGMHQLLIKYPPSGRLQDLLHELGPVPETQLKSKRGEVSLPLASRWESMMNRQSDSIQIHKDALFLETKSLLVNIRRTFPEMHAMPIEDLVNYASRSTNPSISDRGIRARVMLGTSDCNVCLLESEVQAEVARLGSMTSTLKEEATSLRNVFVTVREHNEYLESQLNTFRSYINNIRSHIVPEARKAPGASSQHVFSSNELFDLGVLKRWPYGKAMSALLALKFAPGSSAGSYSLAMVHSDRPTLPLLMVYFTVDDLLDLQDRNQDVDLRCLRLAPGPLLELLPQIC